MKPISLDDINSWSDFKPYAESMPNTKSMGDAFEQLTKLYFQINPLYRSKYEEVWLLDEVPSKDLEYLDLPRQDLGIDLIAKSGDEYHAIQCKYHSDKTNTVKNSEISTFTSILANKKNLSHGYICSTALSTSRNFNKLEIENISNILFDTWSTLDQEFFDNARKILENKKPKEKPFVPKPHQKKAIRLAHKHFINDNNSRGKLIFPCGSGKSLTGFWMMEKLKANSTVVAVPSLSLVKQTLEVYLKQVVAKNKNVKWLCICSDEGIGKSDDVVTYTRDLPVPCTTDPDYIKKWLKDNKNDNIIIFTTYQSGRLIAEASKSLKFTFDLGVYDEAHKTVGKNENLFSYLLFEENISVKHRIFMTATERFYRGVRDDVLTMDDPDDYGDVFCHMSFKEAIEEGLLTDYKIITIEVKKEEIAGFIKDNNLVKSNAKWGKENEARSLASMIALRKAMKALPIKNAVSFHSSIERATRNKEVQKHITETYKYKQIETYHVSGKLPTTKRNDIIQEFAKSNGALITNSRCLTEGVDVPNIDCIVFADPRKSKVDIVQALGRALRKKDGKDFGYVVLPVIYDHTSHEIDNENFQEILNVIRGLAANDDRIIEEFRDKIYSNRKGINQGQQIFIIESEFMSEIDFVNNLNIKIWDGLSKLKIRDFGLAREYSRSLGLEGMKEWIQAYKRNKIPKDIPMFPDGNAYSNKWISWYDWLGNEDKDPENIALVGLNEIKIYISKKGNSFVPERFIAKSGFKLGQFCKMIRWQKSHPQIHNSLSKMDLWVWDIEEKKFQLAFNELKKLQVNDGNISVPRNYIIKYGDYNLNLGLFVNRARKRYNYVNSKRFKRSKIKNLFDDKNDPRIKLLESLNGWVWNSKPFRPSFEKALRIVEKMGVKSYVSYRKYLRENNPHELPFKPDRFYKNDWISFNHFFGKDELSNVEKKDFFFSYEEAKEFLKVKCKGKINSMGLFKKWKNNDLNIGIPKFPTKMPKSPQNSYKKEWVSSYDFFGKTNVMRPKNEYPHFKYQKISFDELKSLCQERRFKSKAECSSWLKANKEFFYKQGKYAPIKGGEAYNEFLGWDDFLGK